VVIDKSDGSIPLMLYPSNTDHSDRVMGLIMAVKEVRDNLDKLEPILKGKSTASWDSALRDNVANVVPEPIS